MTLTKKMTGFTSDLFSFSAKLPSKRYKKIPVTFFTGIIINACILTLLDFLRRDSTKKKEIQYGMNFLEELSPAQFDFYLLVVEDKQRLEFGGERGEGSEMKGKNKSS